MQVFLTGSTGFIGQALVRTMRGRGWNVTALVRDPDAAAGRWLAGQGVRLVRGDVTQPAGLREAMQGADAVVHNAGVYEFGANRALVERMRAVNVDGTRHVLGAAREAGVARTVCVSTVWAHGPRGPEAGDERSPRRRSAVNAYALTKFDAHDEALRERERGLPLSIVMPNAVVGANDHSVFGHLLRLYLMKRLPPVAWGADSVFAMVDVHALADGICRAAERAPMGEDYFLCGQPQTIRQMLGHWARHEGGIAPLLWLPGWLMKLQLGPLEPLQRWAGLPAFLSREAVSSGLCHLNYSSAKARRDLGWSPPDPTPMWDRIIEEERRLLAQRRGFLDRLKVMPLAPA